MPKTISVIIPVFNEGENVEAIYRQVCEVFSTTLSDFEYEIIYSDNASTDNSYRRIQELAGKDPRVRGIRLSRNFGFQANILSGIINASGDAVVQLDADGEDPPSVIAELVAKWQEGNDVVYGIRQRRVESGLLTMFRKLFYRILQRISDINLPVDAGDFRLIDRKVVQLIKERLPERHPYLRGLISYVGFKQVGVPYDRKSRLSGTSKFNMGSYFAMALDAATSFSRVPLKLVSLVGFLVSFISFVGIIYYLIDYLLGRVPVRGFTALAILLLFVSGIQLMSLGLIGEYIGRIFDEVKNRPRTIVADYCGFNEKPREG